MSTYTQLSYHEREKIYRGLCEKKTMQEIADLIDRHKSTISRELKRNRDHIGYLYPGEAHKMALGRHNANIAKVEKDSALKAYIIEQLKIKYSPKSIAGKWNITHKGGIQICPEAIYQFIYSEEGEQLELKKLLVRSKKKRGFTRKTSKVTNIKNRVSIHERPEHINNRSEIGHYEGDLIFNKGSQSKNILTLTERVTKQTILDLFRNYSDSNS